MTTEPASVYLPMKLTSTGNHFIISQRAHKEMVEGKLRQALVTLDTRSLNGKLVSNHGLVIDHKCLELPFFQLVKIFNLKIQRN